MKYITAMLIAATTLFALDGTGSYKYPMSDNQSILNVYAKKTGYMNLELVPYTCGYLQIFDRHNKEIRTGGLFAASKANIKVTVGTYKIKIVPSKGDCTLNILMPE